METFAGIDRHTATNIDWAALKQLRTNHQIYALTDYHRLINNSANTVTSVIDKQLLLSMVSLGAAGTTLTAVNNAVGLAVEEELPHPLINEWSQYFSNVEGVTTSRNIWGQEYYLFSSQYLESLTQYYGPDTAVLNFRDAPINSQSQINDALSPLSTADSIDSRTRLVISQGIKSNQTWEASLNKEVFTGRFAIGGGQRWIDMMRFQGQFNVAENEKYRAVEVPFTGQELALLIIEPKVSWSTLISDFNQASLQSILDQLSPQYTSIVIPPFAIDIKRDDKEVADLGVAMIESDEITIANPPFFPSEISLGDNIEEESLPRVEEATDDEANFYPVNKAGYLYINTIQQQTMISVTTDGVLTEANSTVVHRAKDNEPLWLLDNGPENHEYNVVINSRDNTIPCYYPADQQSFMFALYARSSGSLVSLGHVTELEGETVAADWTTYLGGEGCGSSPPIEIYKSTGAIQCESSGVDPYTMMNELLNSGIDVLEWGTGTDGVNRPSVCGSETGDINRFTIREQDLELAQSLGFSLLSELDNQLYIIH